MSMSVKEAEEVMAQPEYANRTAIYAYEDGDDYVAEWDGHEVRAGNPFGLDSRLSEIGAPAPRNLFFIEGAKP